MIMVISCVSIKAFILRTDPVRFETSHMLVRLHNIKNTHQQKVPISILDHA